MGRGPGELDASVRHQLKTHLSAPKQMWNLREKLIRDSAARKKTLLTLAWIVIWSFFLWRALSVFGPSGTANDVTFNSDCAIPVLMSNDERPLTAFNLYYYGADRWGGWPFLVTQLVRRATGYHWTDQSLFIFLTLWLFAGLLVISRLGRDAHLLSALAFLIPLCLHAESRFQIYELSQLYAWQLTAMLLGWFSLRRFFESRFGHDAADAFWKQAVWLAAAFWFSFLAVWSSIASIIFLAFFLLIEIARMRLKLSAKIAWKREGETYALGLISLVAAFFCEWILKWDYHRYSLKHFGSDFSVAFRLDRGFLKENFSQQWHLIARLTWWPLYLLPALAITAVVIVFTYAYFKKKRLLLERLRDALTKETAILAIAAYGVALINFLLTVLVNHVRLNDYDDRYLTLTYLFAPASALLTIFLLIKQAVKNRPRLSRQLQPALVAIAILLLLIRFPEQGRSAQYEFYKETALALAQKAPRGLLLGDYWDTYVFAALERENALTPVPLEGQEVRLPWTIELVRHAENVVVAYNRIEPRGFEPLAEHLQQYGVSLRLVNPNWFENEGYIFALYANETR